MKPLGEWLKPPAALLLILFSLTLVSVSALGWFGWKLLAQERLVEAQRAQERLDRDADRMVANLRGALAETGERLAAAQSPEKDSADGLLLRVAENSLAAYPAGRLLYYPYVSSEAEARLEIFAEAESFEFLQ